MTNLEKINAITKCITPMGSTVLPVLEFGSFIMAFGVTSSTDSMYLYDIVFGNVRFCKINVERSKNGKNYPDYTTMLEMPLHWFSETFLYGLLVELKKSCKSSLTEKAYEKIINEIGETPETDNISEK